MSTKIILTVTDWQDAITDSQRSTPTYSSFHHVKRSIDTHNIPDF